MKFYEFVGDLKTIFDTYTTWGVLIALVAAYLIFFGKSTATFFGERKAKKRKAEKQEITTEQQEHNGCIAMMIVLTVLASLFGYLIYGIVTS